jgi:hypothetical protein
MKAHVIATRLDLLSFPLLTNSDCILRMLRCTPLYPLEQAGFGSQAPNKTRLIMGTCI